MERPASWDDLSLKQATLRGVYAYGFDNPSPIQVKAIPSMLTGRDLIAQAQSGTGKTGCFTVGAIELTDASKRTLQILILSPTRELAVQSHSVLCSLSKFTNIRTSLVIGGTSTSQCIRELESTCPHIIVGTPGRVFDMLNKRVIDPRGLKTIIIDEADEMLSCGFKDQVHDLFREFPASTQVCLFSATIPPAVLSLTDSFMRDPERVLVNSEMLTLEGIQQFRVTVDTDESKFACIKDIFTTISIAQAIIYCNSVRRVADLAKAMQDDGFAVAAIHGDMDKQEREASYHDFKAGKYRVLISSNLTARGIDIQQVSTVINFDLTRDVHTYLHRIGRSGRWGRKGVSISFVTARDEPLISDIEKHYSTTIRPLPEDWSSALALNSS